MDGVSLSVIMPIRTVSESNARGHWSKKARRAKDQRFVTWAKLRGSKGEPSSIDTSVIVTLTRIAPRKLDDDNLRGALKACRDGVADWLGIEDNDPRVSWQYGQEHGEPKQYAVRIDVKAT